MRCVPLWLWGLFAVAHRFAVQTVPPWLSLPLPYGTLIGIADPDPWLRLTIVRDWLTGGSWYSHLMLHSNAPWGGNRDAVDAPARPGRRRARLAAVPLGAAPTPC